MVVAAHVPYCWQQHNRKDYLNIAVFLVWGFIAWNWCCTKTLHLYLQLKGSRLVHMCDRKLILKFRLITDLDE